MTLLTLGDRRIVTRFLLWPKVINHKIHWLSRQSWIEEVQKVEEESDIIGHGPVYRTYHEWIEIEWCPTPISSVVNQRPLTAQEQADAYRQRAETAEKALARIQAIVRDSPSYTFLHGPSVLIKVDPAMRGKRLMLIDVDELDMPA